MGYVPKVHSQTNVGKSALTTYTKGLTPPRLSWVCEAALELKLTCQKSIWRGRGQQVFRVGKGAGAA